MRELTGTHRSAMKRLASLTVGRYSRVFMRTSLFLLPLFALSFACFAEDSALRIPEEQAAWKAIAARFTEAPKVKTDSAKTQELAVSGLRTGKPGDAGSASVTVDKASGHVIAVTANGANFNDAEIASFAAFSELNNLALFHNSGFTGSGLASLANLKKLERITLAGGSLEDAGMRELAKFPALRELRVFHSKFTDAGVIAFQNNPTLEYIWIGPQWTSRQTDKSIAALATCPKLKKLAVDQTWLTWEGSLKALAARTTPLADIDFVNCIIEPADMEKLRQATPSAKIAWKGFGSGAEELQKAWIKSAAEQWIPKELLERVRVEGAKLPPTESKAK